MKDDREEEGSRSAQLREGPHVDLAEAKRLRTPGLRFVTPLGVFGEILPTLSPRGKREADMTCSESGCLRVHTREQSDWQLSHRCREHGRPGRSPAPGHATTSVSHTGRGQREKRTPHRFPVGRRLATLPELIVHADWGTIPRKRAAVRAAWHDNRYVLSAPHAVESPSALISEALEIAERGGSSLLGFDFAIGIPAAFAVTLAVDSFRDFLLRADDSIFTPVSSLDEVSPSRPFLAQMPAGSTEDALRRQLGLTVENQLRLCERATSYRGNASCLFIPKAFKQVAGATRTGWREVVRPALQRDQTDDRRVRLWPFDGDLGELVAPGNVVLGETYPGELYAHLDLEGGSKRKPEWRRAQSGQLIQSAERAEVEMTDDLLEDIRAGFPDRGGPDGEDRFDALVGALGLVRIALGLDRCEAPADPSVRIIEGWIMGRPIDL